MLRSSESQISLEGVGGVFPPMIGSKSCRILPVNHVGSRLEFLVVKQHGSGRLVPELVHTEEITEVIEKAKQLHEVAPLSAEGAVEVAVKQLKRGLRRRGGLLRQRFGDRLAMTTGLTVNLAGVLDLSYGFCGDPLLFA